MDPTADPEAANRLTEEAVGPPKEVAPPEIPETTVTLPGGLLLPTGEVLDRAEVREMNGEDEEALARLPRDTPIPQRITEMVKRCLVSLSGRTLQPGEIDSLLIGDRDLIMVALRRATYGDDMEVTVTCPFCTTDWNKPKTFDVAIELDKDISTKEMDDKKQRIFPVKLRRGEAEVRLVTGGDQIYAVGDGTRSAPQVNTGILERCVRSLNGNQIIGREAVAKMGSADRLKLLEVIVDKQPGPQLGDITTPCSMCGETVPLPIAVGDLFRL
jgi:hypothetical protein